MYGPCVVVDIRRGLYSKQTVVSLPSDKDSFLLGICLNLNTERRAGGRGVLPVDGHLVLYFYKAVGYHSIIAHRTLDAFCWRLWQCDSTANDVERSFR